MRVVDPGCYGRSRLLGNFELHRAMGLLLHNRCSRQYTIGQSNVSNMQLDQITSPQFAIDSKVEQREVPDPISKIWCLILRSSKATGRRPDGASSGRFPSRPVLDLP
jgi:hypothetical protein